VWLEFVGTLRKLAAERGRTLQVWGDFLRKSPELIPEVPGDITVLDWGYERERSLGKSAKYLARAGVPFVLCPGTSSWTSIAGRTDNAVANILNAVESAHRHGAQGVLLTDWGDCGHWQHLPVSYLPFAWSAALCWSLESNRGLDLPRALDCFAFHDEAGVIGKLARDLGNAYLAPGFRRGNSSMLFWFYTVSLDEVRASWMPRMREGQELLASDDAVRDRMNHTLAYLDGVLSPLGSAELGGHEGALIKREFAHAGRMLQHSARRVLFQLGDRGWSPEDLIHDLDAIEAEFLAMWLARNRTGGLHDSVHRLRQARTMYAPSGTGRTMG
jgi:hexosaminidase